MKVPEELIDEIFSHLPPDDKRSLHSCSLVSKSWLQPSRRVLFARVSIGVDTYQSWLDNILPTNTELLRHVRSLTYLVRQAGGSYLRVDALRDYLPSFCQLQILTFKAVKIPSIPGHLELFPAFKHSLSSLSIVVSSIRWCAFVALLGSFPHLKNLEIHWQYFQVDDEPTPQIPHTLGGRLLVEPFRSKHMSPFVDRFPELRQGYEELVVVGELDPRLVVAVQANLRYLKIDRCGRTLISSVQCDRKAVAYRLLFFSGKHPRPLMLSRTPSTRNCVIVPIGGGADASLIDHLREPPKNRFQTSEFPQFAVPPERARLGTF